MASKIDKIGIVNPNDSNIIYNRGMEFPSYIKVKADCEVEIKVFKSGANSKLRPKWIAKPREKGPFTSNDVHAHTGEKMGAKVEAKYCGPQIYHIEAYIDEPINKTPNRILVQGYAPEKIVKAEWRKSKTGSSLGSAPNKFGDDVWLHLDTEGLNGAKLSVMVYNNGVGEDDFVTGFYAKCHGGELNLNIKNTYKWRSKTGWHTSDSEEFYVKIQVTGKNYFISDKSGKKEIGEYIVFKDKITKRTTEKSVNNLPVKVDSSEIDLERYEPCRFKKITITDEGHEFELFEEGKLKIDEDNKKEFAVSEKIYFGFDEAKLKPSAKKILDGIATFLLDSPFVPVTLGAHCDSRGTDEHNDLLSFRRASSSVKYLISKGVSSSRIRSMGYGKRKLYIEGKNLTEEQHELNRRVTVRFNIYGGDAQSIIFNVIAPDKSIGKESNLKVGDYKVPKCLRKDLNDPHDERVYVIELTGEGKSEPIPYENSENVKHEIYSNSARYKLAPLEFILPHKVTPNKFLYYIHSCRYYSDKKKATVVTNVYPDIKWDFHVFGKLSNPLAVTWNGLDASGFEDMKDVSGKLAAQSRWEKSDAAFGAALNANWNKTGKNKYKDNFAAGYTYENNFKWIYELFKNIQGISQTIAELTGSEVKEKTSESAAFDIKITPPNISFGAEWQLDRASDDGKVNSKIGTLIKPYLKAEPFIGMVITFDLLAITVKGLSMGITGNAAAADVFLYVRDWAERGYDSERITIEFKMWIDAILSGSINGGIEGEFNTESTGDTKIAVEMNTKIDVELSAGIKLTGKIIVIKTGIKDGKAEGYGGEATAEASASSGKIGIVLGGKIQYEQKKGLFLEPLLLLQECTASIILLIEVKLSLKKNSPSWKPINETFSNTFWEETNILEAIFDKQPRYTMIDL